MQRSDMLMNPISCTEIRQVWQADRASARPRCEPDDFRHEDRGQVDLRVAYSELQTQSTAAPASRKESGGHKA